MKLFATSVLVSLFVFTAQASLAGDAEKGAKVFKKCVACHMVGDGAQNRVGPQLNGIIGRPIASLAEFSYSKGMQNFAESDAVWTEENLAAYLENPRQTVKGTRMSFAGLRKPSDRDDVVAYLKTFE